MWTIELVVILLMIAFNSVLAGYEIALASVATGRLHVLESQRRRGAASALRMKQNIESSLAVVQLGITLVGAIAAATGGAGAEESIEPILREWGFSPALSQLAAISLVVVPLIAITILFGELVPKVFAMRNKEWICLKLSPPMEWFAYAVWPAVWFFESAVTLIVKWGERAAKSRGATDGAKDSAIQEIHGAATMARIARLIGQREEAIIVSAARLASTPMRKVMLPANYIDTLIADQTTSQALVAAHQSMHTRYPVTEELGNPQRIVGYVNFKDIVATLRMSPPDQSFRSLVRNIAEFNVHSSVADCLEYLMRDRNHIALIRENDGRVVGMVTLEDILEELVGEIHDEMDRMPTYLNPAGQGWIAGGFVSLSRLRDRTGIELKPVSEKPVYTLNDWIVERLGRPPQGGDAVESENCRVVVRKTRKVLVQEAYLCASDAAGTVNAPQAEAD